MTWLHHVRQDPKLSAGSKRLASVLLQRFASSSHGGHATFYDDAAACIIGLSSREIGILRQELTQAGYLPQLRFGNSAPAYRLVWKSEVT